MGCTAINLPATVSAALLVIAGQYGNGEARKNKLKKAGYDPNKVQNCVNDMLKILERYGD